MSVLYSTTPPSGQYLHRVRSSVMGAYRVATHAALRLQPVSTCGSADAIPALIVR